MTTNSYAPRVAAGRSAPSWSSGCAVRAGGGAAARRARLIRFRGSADRVDRAGEAIVVVDYKTGSAKPFKGLE